jgi:hypothetical protein
LRLLNVLKGPAIGNQLAWKESEMDLILRRSLQGSPGVTEASGLVYAFVPAHGASKAGTVSRELSRTLSEGLGLSVLLADFYARGFPLWGTTEAPQRLDGRTWGAFVTPGEAFDTLEAREAHPREIRRLLDHARCLYNVTCADLTESKEVVSLEVLRQADAIFIVSSSDAASLDIARYRAAWLRSIGLEGHSGMLLQRAAGGFSVPEAEERTGLPVCSVVDTGADVGRLAAWLGAAQRPECVTARAC